MKVNFINSSYRRFYSSHKEEINFAMFRCLSEGDFILRQDVAEFEKTLAEYIGTKYAVGVNSGTDALFLSLKSLGIKKGDEVICPSHTFIATIAAIVFCGARPILVDVKEDGLMDMDNLEYHMRTCRAKAIIPVHLSGKVCDMGKVLEISTRHKIIPIIEDACQALGATYQDVKAGSFGKTGCFSFISPKTLGGISDGGAITTNDKEIYEKLLLLRNHWCITQNALLGVQPKQPEIMDWGYNSRLGNVTAAFLNVKFRYYDKMLNQRQNIAEKYYRGLNDLPIILPSFQSGQIWSEYIIMVEDQEDFKNYLQNKGIETLVRDRIPNHKLKGLNLEHFNLPVTELLAKKQVRLPIYPELTDKEVEYIVKIIKEYYEK